MKKILIPLIALPLLLVGCTSNNADPAPTESAGNVINEEVGDNGTKFPQFTPISQNPSEWEQYSKYGATLPSEDPALREITPEEFNALTNSEDTLKIQGEVTADAEATAITVSEWLKEHPEVKEEVNLPPELITNRYPNLITVSFSPMSNGNYEIYFISNDGAAVTGYAQTSR